MVTRASAATLVAGSAAAIAITATLVAGSAAAIAITATLVTGSAAAALVTGATTAIVALPTTLVTRTSAAALVPGTTAAIAVAATLETTTVVARATVLESSTAASTSLEPVALLAPRSLAETTAVAAALVTVARVAATLETIPTLALGARAGRITNFFRDTLLAHGLEQSLHDERRVTPATELEAQAHHLRPVVQAILFRGAHTQVARQNDQRAILTLESKSRHAFDVEVVGGQPFGGQHLLEELAVRPCVLEARAGQAQRAALEQLGRHGLTEAQEGAFVARQHDALLLLRRRAHE